MTISLFSGQGSQTPGMGGDIIAAVPEVAEIYEAGSDILGMDLKAVCLDAPAEELSRTINSQPAIMATSMACLKAAQLRGFEFDGVAGHSLGEYAAMYASGMVSLEDAFRLIKARAAAMEEAVSQTKGAMAAVMKLEPAKVEEVCAAAQNFVTAVNYNSPVQTVIAGTPEGIEEVTPIFKEMKGRVIPLNVAGAFHSKLMQPAADLFYETAKIINFSAPDKKYYSNVTGGELTDFSDMASMLAKHIVSPVRFTSELMAMSQAGADRFVEFGPGRTLTGLVKKTLPEAAAFNVENMETLEGAAIYE
ncbi:MAG: ACP S-malonyltransferase [Ruminococcus sp.]|nr:ACP S-malonyltransferase [Ruminococcus sp.]